MIMILNTITACNASQNTKDRLLKHLMNNCACCVEFIEMHRRRREGRHQGPICFGGILMKFSSRSLLQFSRHRLEHKLAQVMDSPNSSWSHLFVSLKHQLDVCCVFIRSQERKQGNATDIISSEQLRKLKQIKPFGHSEASKKRKKGQILLIFPVLGKMTHMGQFPEDGGNGHFVSFFFKK